jgi:hypothetical protein
MREGMNMNSRCLGLLAKVLLCLLAILVPLPSCSAADAYTYDDFNKPLIDSSKWVVNDPSRLFSQQNGYLHFHSTAGVASLRSTSTFTAGFFTMEFHDFYSTNNSRSGQGQGSFVALGLGPKENCVRILRGRVSSGGYFEANLIVNNILRLWYVPAAESDTDGQLGLYFDGSKIRFYYNKGLDSDSGWQKVGPTVTAPWSSGPTLFISGNPGGSGTTTFSINGIEHRPVPPLPSLLLPEP